MEPESVTLARLDDALARMRAKLAPAQGEIAHLPSVADLTELAVCAATVASNIAHALAEREADEAEMLDEIERTLTSGGQ
jgi:hypothetical protein